jgi:3-oxoacyl-[acyl-carrier protein] reductase
MIDCGLTNRVVLVTGGSGGIGAAVCRAFARQGARVAVHHLAAEPAAPSGTQWEHITPPTSVAEALADELGGAAVAADLSAPDAAHRLLDDVEKALGPVAVLGIDDLTADGLERNYRVNAIAPALLTSELARRATPDGPPCIVNITTDAARAFPGQIGYGTSKAALEALTRASALDLGPRGIRVNAVAPGPVQTGWMGEDLVVQVEPMVPLRRVGEPADIADAAVFLASHQARWITGQVLQVAGGHAL